MTQTKRCRACGDGSIVSRLICWPPASRRGNIRMYYLCEECIEADPSVLNFTPAP